MDLDTMESNMNCEDNVKLVKGSSNYSQCPLCPNGHECTPGSKISEHIRRSEETQTEVDNSVSDGDRTLSMNMNMNKIKTLSRNELEEMIIKFIIEAMNSHADMKKLRDTCQKLNSTKDRLFQKSISLQKQVIDLTASVRQITDNMNRNPKSSTPAPVRFLREIGLQVGIPAPKASGRLIVSGPKPDKFVNIKNVKSSRKKADVDVIKQQMKDITNDTVVLQNSTNTTNANLVQNQEVDNSKNDFISAVKVKQQEQKQKQLIYSPVNNYLNISRGPPSLSSPRPRQIYTRQPRPTQQYVNNNLRQVLLLKQQQPPKIESVDLNNIVEITETDQLPIGTQNQGQLVYGENGELQFIPKPLEVLDSQFVSEVQIVNNPPPPQLQPRPRLQLQLQQQSRPQLIQPLPQLRPQTSQEFLPRSIFRLKKAPTTVVSSLSNQTSPTPSGSGQIRPRHISVFRMGQSGSLQQQRFMHPATIRPKFALPPFPPPPASLPSQNSSIRRGNHLLPPKPELTLKINESGIINLSWNCISTNNNAEIDCYQLYSCQELISEIPNQNQSPQFTQWKSMGDVKALPLPMGCNISHISGNNKHFFIVRGIDVYNRAGEFSNLKSIVLNTKA